MSTMQTRLGDARNWIENHRAQALAVLILLAAIALIIGLSLSWFVGSKSLSTVGKIQTPAQLKIMGPNQTSIESIEISYDESRGDVKKHRRHRDRSSRVLCAERQWRSRCRRSSV